MFSIVVFRNSRVPSVSKLNGKFLGINPLEYMVTGCITEFGNDSPMAVVV